MLETAADSFKRYAPPSQRNRVLNRRKSGDHGEMSAHSEKRFPGVIAIDGCCTSDAARLLNERWAAAINSYHDPMTDSSEKPMMYSGASGSSWGHVKPSYQMDFLSELQRAIQNTGGAVSMPAVGAHFSS